MKVPYQLVIDLKRRNKSYTIFLQQFDNMTREIRVVLMSDGYAVDMTEAGSAIIHAAYTDSDNSQHVLDADMTIEKDDSGNNANVLTFTVPATWTQVATVMACKAEINFGTDTISTIYTPEFYINVDNTLYESSENVTEAQVKTLQSRIDQANTNLAASTEQLAKSDEAVKAAETAANNATSTAAEAKKTAEEAKTYVNEYLDFVNSLGESYAELDNDLRANGAGSHNAIYRGTKLGDSVTESQWAAIKDGTFKGLYLGDYWTINNVNWRIAAFDHYLGMFNSSDTNHHIVMVPDTVLYQAKMNTSATNSGGYLNSAMYKTNLATAVTQIKTAFGEAHVMPFYTYLPNATSSSGMTGSVIQSVEAVLMNECQMIGTRTHSAKVYPAVIDYRILPVFLFNRNLTRSQGYDVAWLMDTPANNTGFCAITNVGSPAFNDATKSYGVRPIFCLYQA